jgi:beta-lactamase class A
LDHAVEQELVEIAQKIRIDSDALLAKQKQRRLNSINLTPTEKQTLQVPKYRRQLAAYMAKVRQQRGRHLSALAFQQVFATDIEPTIWLACVMNECLKQQHKALQIEWKEASQGSGFTGNKKICDIVLCCQTGEQ